MANDTTKLRVELEATTAKFVASMRKAQKQGTITATELDKVLARANASVANQSKKAAAGMRGLSNVSGASRFVLSNTANQIGDIAVQLEGGTGAMKVMGQQMPQILGGFGALGGSLGLLGPLLGTVAAVGFPIAGMFMAMGDEAEDLQEKSDQLAQAIRDYSAATENALIPTDELIAKYGTATAAARSFAQALHRITETKATESIEASIGALIADALGSDIELTPAFATLDELKARVFELKKIIQTGEQDGRELDVSLLPSLNDDLSGTTRLLQAMTVLSDSLGVASDQAFTLVNAFYDLQSAQGPKEQADAAVDLQRALVAAYGEYENMSAAARALYEETGRVGEAALELGTEIDKARISADDLRAAFDAAQGGASSLVSIAETLATTMADVAAAAWDAAQAMGAARAAEITRGPDGAVEDTRNNLTPDGRPRDTIVFKRTYNSGKPAQRGGASGGSGGSSGAGGGYSAQDVMDMAADEIDAIKQRIELIGKTDAQVAALTLKYKLLEEAKRRGIDLDQQNAATGETLRQGIDRQAEAMAGLTEKYDKAKSQQAALSNVTQQFEGAVMSAFDGASDSVQGFIEWMKKAALQYALFGSGPLAGAFGGGSGGSGFGGVLGGLLSFDGGGATGSGPRSGGVDGKGGFPAILHPKETVIDHTKGGASSGAARVDVYVQPSGEFDTRVAQVSGQVAVGVSGQMISENNRAVSQMQGRR